MLSKVCAQSALRTLLSSRTHPVISAASLKTSAIFQSQSKAAAPIGEHAKLFKIERIFSAATLPLLPLSYFVHGQAMDYVLIAAIVLNAHWGGTAVLTDYARWIIVGDKLAALAPKLMYGVSAILLALLLHFQINDVGLTRAFEIVFSL